MAVALIAVLVASAVAAAALPFRVLAATQILSDGCESGDLSSWTVGTGGDGTATVQSSIVKTGTKAARLAESNQPGSFAYLRTSLSPAARTPLQAASP